MHTKKIQRVLLMTLIKLVVNMSKIFTVDVGSFIINEEEYKRVNDMNIDQQRKWLADQILEGYCDVDQIFEENEVNND